MKYGLLIVITCFFGLPAAAQWQNPLVKEARELNRRGQYETALRHLDEALNTVEARREEEPGLYAMLTLERGVALNGRDQLDEALKAFLKATSLAASVWGEQSNNYRACTDRLINCYNDLGQYGEASRLLQARVESEETPDDLRLQDYRSLAQLYDRRLKNPNRAQEYEQQGLALARKLYGENHESYWYSLYRIGDRQTDMGKPQEAIKTLEDARTLAESIFRPSDDRLRLTLSALQRAHQAAGNKDRAATLKNETNWESRFKMDNEPASLEPYDVFVHVQQLLFADEYEKAEHYLLKGLEHIEQNYSIQNPFYNLFLYDLSTLAFQKNDLDKAYQYLRMANESLDQRVRHSFGVLSEQEKGNFIRKLGSFYNNILFRAFTSGESLPQLKGLAYNNVLNLKGILLSSTRRTMQAIRAGGNTELLRTYEIWTAAKKQLAQAYSLPAGERDEIVGSLENWVEDLESELIQGSSAFQQAQQQIRWEDVRSALAPGEAAIEFVAMDLYDSKSLRTPLYYALLLRADLEYPALVALCRESDLRGLLENDQLADQSFVKSLYGSSRGIRVTRVNENEEEDQAPAGADLYRLLWRPLEPHLAGIEKIYYAPAGLLHRVAIHALPSDEHNFLLDRFQLYRLSSTRQLATGLKDAEQKTRSVTLFGGIDYDYAYEPSGNWLRPEGREAVAGQPSLQPDRSALRDSWGPLPGTREEVDSLHHLLTSAGVESRTFVEKEATEEALKFEIESGSARDVLHLATHGFFFPDSEPRTGPSSLSFKSADNPLIRSGLLLAGANHTWQGSQAPSGREDGILTAFEVANLNLQDIRLAVLSACETGLGDIRGSEGVYGLQRAFNMAGVDKLIISLWKVPDQETVELMEAFYSKWLAGKDLHTAFYEAQQQLRSRYAPYYWAAFVLIE